MPCGPADLGFHECRHTFASIAIAAGVNARALADYMGQAFIQTTYDLYGHLMPGNEAEAASLLDAYLDTEAPRRSRARRPITRTPKEG